MLYVRFMGRREYDLYMAGETLKNKTRWGALHRSSSVGFCFFDTEDPPEKRMEYLTGVVDMDVVAVFRAESWKMFRRGTGRYRDPDKDMPETLYEMLFGRPTMMDVPEYSTEEYSRHDMRLVKVGRPMIGEDGRKYITWDKELKER